MNTQVLRTRLEFFFDTLLMHSLVGIVSLANAILIGLNTYPHITKTYGEMIHTINIIVVWLFFVEVGLRIVASGWNFFKKPWSLFDLSITLISAFPSNSVFAVLRALRALSLFLMLDALPKTRHILHGLVKSIPGIINVSIMFCLFFYIAMVIGVLLFPQSSYFSDLGAAMESLVQVLTADNWTDIVRSTSHDYPSSWIYFYSFVIIMTFILLNLFIGVFVSALQEATDEINAEKNQEPDPVLSMLDKTNENIARLEAEINFLRQQLQQK